MVLYIHKFECPYTFISILDIHRYAHVHIWDQDIDRSKRLYTCIYVDISS